MRRKTCAVFLCIPLVSVYVDFLSTNLTTEGCRLMVNAATTVCKVNTMKTFVNLVKISRYMFGTTSMFTSSQILHSHFRQKSFCSLTMSSLCVSPRSATPATFIDLP